MTRKGIGTLAAVSVFAFTGYSSGHHTATRSGASADTAFAYELALPVVSPDGSHIAWVDVASVGGPERVFVARPDGRRARGLGPRWPDGISAMAWTRAGIVVESEFRVFLLSWTGRVIRIGPAGDITFSVGGSRVASGTAGCRAGHVCRSARRDRHRQQEAVAIGPRRIGGTWNPRFRRTASKSHGQRRTNPGWRGLRRISAPVGRWSLPSVVAERPLDRLPLREQPQPAPRAGVRRSKPDTLQRGERLPNWSPDSTRIAFEPGRRLSRLSIVNANTHRVHRASPGLGIAGYVAWRPDGSHLYVNVAPKPRDRLRRALAPPHCHAPG